MDAIAHSPNRLLSSLSREEFQLLRPHLKTVELKLGAVLFESGGAVDRIYFPHSGIVSLVADLNDGAFVEAAMVGRDGVVGASSALDGKISMCKAIVQMPGAASVLDVARVEAIADKNKTFRTHLIRHEQVIFAQAQQSAACNAKHSVEARMCRWLLHLRDLSGADEFPLTHEFLAQMLGVRRTSVTIVAKPLQQKGLLSYRRGHMKVLDVDGLRDTSCECYGHVKDHYDRLLQRE